MWHQESAGDPVVGAVVGLRTGDLPAGVNHEAVHRDDLVVLPA